MRKVKEKGVFLTTIIVFFLISLIYFSSTINSSINSYSTNYSILSKINSVNSKFNSIYSNIILLDSNGAMKELKERILPFTYSLDENSFTLTSTIPLTESSQEIYFDYINTFRVLISDENYSNSFDGIQTDFNTAKNELWFGDANSMNFLLNSHCAKNSFTDLNTYVFQFVPCGSKEFDFNAVKSIDLNLTTNSAFNEDFNSIYCNFNGVETCFQNDFNASNNLPFIRIIFDSENCVNCDLNSSKTIISTHFNPSNQNYVVFSCQGIDCESNDLRIDLQNQLIISRSGVKRINFTIKYDFNSTTSQLETNDINYSVSTRDNSTTQVFSK